MIASVNSAFDDLIETLWNVNTQLGDCYPKRVLDLIETLWNVKEYELSNIVSLKSDLIDTLWNVKTSDVCTRYSDRTRFNSCIVECKETSLPRTNEYVRDLMDHT